MPLPPHLVDILGGVPLVGGQVDEGPVGGAGGALNLCIEGDKGVMC